MAASQQNLKIEFKGDLSGLSIVVNGKPLPLDKRMFRKKLRSPAQLKAQEYHSVITAFARGVNKIPVLKRIWNKTYCKIPYRPPSKKITSPYENPKKMTPFNKIISFNGKIKQITDHPTEKNLIVPNNLERMPAYNAVLLLNELKVKINLIVNNAIMNFAEEEKVLIGAILITPYNPKRKAKLRFEVISKWIETIEFRLPECQINFPITIDESAMLNKYKDCNLYLAIVSQTSAGKIIRCFFSKGQSSSLADYPVGPVHFTNEPKH